MQIQSLFSGVSVGNVGGRDADSSLHGGIYGVFRKICLETVTIQQVLNSYKRTIIIPCSPCVPWLKTALFDFVLPLYHNYKQENK